MTLEREKTHLTVMEAAASWCTESVFFFLFFFFLNMQANYHLVPLLKEPYLEKNINWLTSPAALQLFPRRRTGSHVP